jgi:hypothetical protein
MGTAARLIMPRFFTLQQAEQVLPRVASAIREVIALKTEYERAEAEWQNFCQRLAVTGGMQVDRVQVLEKKNRREGATAAIQEAIERVHEFGCLVKDLDTGLIDFPTLFQGEEVYLCWKLGEPGIQFWHSVNEGFRGRKAIDAAFLEHHRGELPN